MQKYHAVERPAAKGSLMTRLFKRLLALALVAGLAGVVIYASSLPSVQKQFTGRRAAKLLGDGPIPVTVAPAQLGDVPLYLEGVGTAKARNTVTVRPQVDGRILSIDFREGQDVKRGDILAKIDPAKGHTEALRLAKYGAPVDSRDDALEALVAVAQEDGKRQDEIRTTLEGYLNDPSFVLREKAYQVLGTLGDPAAIPAIERRARAEAEERQRRNAAKAVEEIRARRAEGREEQALRDRVEQLERETEVLKERLREVQETKGGSQ